MQIEIERLEFVGDGQDGHFKRTKEVREYKNSDHREIELCVICGFPEYPGCLEWCKNGQFAMKKEGAKSRD